MTSTPDTVDDEMLSKLNSIFLQYPDRDRLQSFSIESSISIHILLARFWA